MGIDPGLMGAVAVLPVMAPQGIHMPVVGKRIDGRALSQFLLLATPGDHGVDHTCIAQILA
jgi:hypothetical protein